MARHEWLGIAHAITLGLLPTKSTDNIDKVHVVGPSAPWSSRRPVVLTRTGYTTLLSAAKAPTQAKATRFVPYLGGWMVTRLTWPWSYRS
jgi:hypothetical protein